MVAVGALSSVVRRRESETPRPDLAAREETKFRCDGADLDAIRAVLARRCRSIRYAGPVSTVYSLYFDGPALPACRANLDGATTDDEVIIQDGALLRQEGENFSPSFPGGIVDFGDVNGPIGLEADGSPSDGRTWRTQ